MKKLFVVPAIVLALASLLILAACPDGNGNEETVVNTSALEAAIKEANDAKFGVQEADNASDVAEGLFWVTEAQMKALNDAIGNALIVKDNPSSQSLVNNAVTSLRGATTTFKDAKKEGTARAIKLSGTITVKNNGQTVPFVDIYAHDDGWGWSGSARLVSPGENAPWEIITKPFSVSTKISYRVAGLADANYTEELFNIDVKDFSTYVYDQDISGININLSNLKVITMSGTINISNGGKPIPSVAIQAQRKSDGFYLGETVVRSAGNNTPWSIRMEALDTETEVTFGVVGFNGPNGWSESEVLFSFWGQDFGTTIKDQNKGGIALNFITLSGTINVSYDGEPVPYMVLRVFYETEDEYGNVYYDTNFDETNLASVGNNTSWSILLKVFDDETKIAFNVLGFSEWIDPWWEHWEYLVSDEMHYPEPAIMVKNQSKSGIVLDLGDISNTTPVEAEVEIVINMMETNEWELTEQTAQAVANVDKIFTVTGTYTAYQWYLDGTPVGTSSSYTFNKEAGVYQLFIVVTNSAGESRSGNCRITTSPSL